MSGCCACSDGGSEPISPDAAYRLNVCIPQSARTFRRQIAAELNARGIKTARGGKWHATTVQNILTVANGAESCAA
ncbi:recombinase family protein [uncultured Tateyamaria sp.]|nr:recombinase family protein [uncultured Tateyamaria sp.]